MRKPLSEMTLEELWQLFPIFLIQHKEEWNHWYQEEEKRLLQLLPSKSIKRISHIGSPAVSNIWAKDIVDMLLEVSKDLDLQYSKETEFFKKPIGKTYLKVYKTHIEFEYNKGIVKVDIKDIKRLMLQYKDVLEVRFLKDKIRFSTKKRKWSAYLYWKALQYISKINLQ